MKHFSLRIFIALLTFTVGVSIATFWYLRPTLRQATNNSQEQLLGNASA
jgi:hypothetical protein